MWTLHDSIQYWVWNFKCSASGVQLFLYFYSICSNITVFKCANQMIISNKYYDWFVFRFNIDLKLKFRRLDNSYAYDVKFHCGMDYGSRGDGTDRYTSTSSTISGIYRSILPVCISYVADLVIAPSYAQVYKINRFIDIIYSESGSSVYVLLCSSIWWHRNAHVIFVFNPRPWRWFNNRRNAQQQFIENKAVRVVRSNALHDRARAAAATGARERIHPVAAGDLDLRRRSFATIDPGITWTIRWVRTITNLWENACTEASSSSSLAHLILLTFKSLYRFHYNFLRLFTISASTKSVEFTNKWIEKNG